MHISINESDLAESLWWIYYYKKIEDDNEKCILNLYKSLYYAKILGYICYIDADNYSEDIIIHIKSEKYYIKIYDDGTIEYEINMFEYLNDNMTDSLKSEYNFMDYYCSINN